MAGLGSGVARVLLAMERSEAEGGGFAYLYERPGYAWATTVKRPAVSSVDAAALVGVLGAPWTSAGLRGLASIARTDGFIADRPADVAARLIAAERSLMTRLA